MYCFKIGYTPSREPWVCVQWSHRLKIARKQISGKSSLIKSAPGSHTIPYLHNLYLDNFQYHAILAPSEFVNVTQPILPFHASYFITLKPYSILYNHIACYNITQHFSRYNTMCEQGAVKICLKQYPMRATRLREQNKMI